MTRDFTYRTAISELSKLVNRDRLRDITSEGGAAKSVKMRLVDELRSAVEKSSLSVFNGRIYIFTGRIYETITMNDFENMTYELWKQLGLPMAMWDKRSGGVFDIMRSMVFSKHIYPDNSKIVFENGMYDLDSHKFRQDISKSTVQFSIVPFKYNSFAVCPKWQMFLDSVLPDKEYQGMLQEFLGSIFIDRKKVKIETMLILKGAGSNGKSVISDTIRGLLGNENVSTYGISELIFGGLKEQNMANINGKRLNYCPEVDAMNIKGDNATFKALISGEPMRVKVLYSNPFEVYDIPLIMSNCNRLPRVDTWSHSMRRRIVVIPFDISIPVEKQNPRLSVELANEYAGIFNWICAGRERFRLNGCKFTEVMGLTNYLDTIGKGDVNHSSAVRYIYSDQKIGKDWYAYDCARTGQTEAKATYVTITDLYSNYRKWCAKLRITDTMSVHVFRDQLRLAGFDYCRKSCGMVFKLYRITNKNIVK
jgi:putative DNA primase/helicase